MLSDGDPTEVVVLPPGATNLNRLQGHIVPASPQQKDPTLLCSVTATVAFPVMAAPAVAAPVEAATSGTACSSARSQVTAQRNYSGQNVMALREQHKQQLQLQPSDLHWFVRKGTKKP